MHYLKVVIIAVTFLFANAAMAGTSSFVTGTIKSVDLKNNTFTVEFKDSGVTKTYSFPDSINFVDDGVALVDKSAFKPGQSVKLNLETKAPKFFNSMMRNKKEYVLKSMTVD